MQHDSKKINSDGNCLRAGGAEAAEKDACFQIRPESPAKLDQGGHLGHSKNLNFYPEDF